MTDERAKMIADAIEAYEDKEALLAMSPEEAVEALNENGNDFTVDEINEAAEELKDAVKMVSANGEIDIELLDNVSGGRLGREARQLHWQGVATLCSVGGAACMVAAVCW